jgi:integrase
MAAFSGARLEEICQFKTSDIKTDKETGILYTDITETGTAADGEKKKTKSKSSVRPIPIHSTLVEIGFMKYVKTRKKDTSDKALFKLKRDNQDRLGKGFSNWFSRLEAREKGRVAMGYIERCGIPSKGVKDGQYWTKTFHSFRHAAIDNLRNNKTLPSGEYVLETHIGVVMGHSKDKLETANYGQNRSQLELRKDVIEAIGFPNVGFGAIKWRPM